MNARRPIAAAFAASAALLALAACSLLQPGAGTPPTVSPAAPPGSSASATAVVPVRALEDPVRIGTLLPASGHQAAAGDSTRAAVRLAAETVNAAHLGVLIELVDADSGSAGDGRTVMGAEELIAAGVDAVIGPRTSSQALEVYRRFADAGIVQISPSNTLPALSSIDADGFYFRTAPTDVLQAEVLGRRVLFDGATTISILRVGDAYGEALARGLAEVFASVGAEVLAEVEIGSDAAAARTVAGEPEAIVVIAEAARFAEVAADLEALGVDWGRVYGTDASLEALRDHVDGPQISGAVFSSPGVLADRDIERAVQRVDPSVRVFNYAPETYDAVVLIALAALRAGSTDGAAIRDELRAVSGGGGRPVTTFAEGAALIRAGIEIDYDGLSGPIDFAPNGDVTAGFISFYRYGERNALQWIDQSFGRLRVD